ncbi:hypothetical protein L2227_06580 [Wolbachia endosymbiont of Delia radicum]|uniref:hypothetical protein n=1 Tax=unclassified Wolbachia TaxID=2640676 RepID=UPI001F1C8DBE|nr:MULTISPECIES: hypothetical protein [unclassified Wolbachia]UJQ20803.1 hypothetical protein L2227_06580 [Wolbachia endosymbiont of Delia radicum]
MVFKSLRYLVCKRIGFKEEGFSEFGVMNEPDTFVCLTENEEIQKVKQKFTFST